MNEDLDDWELREGEQTEKKLVVLGYAFAFLVTGTFWYLIYRLGLWLMKINPGLTMALGLGLMMFTVCTALTLCLRK